MREKDLELFAFLKRRAANNEPCPDNRELGEMFDLKLKASAHRALRRLVYARLIRIEYIGTLRVIEIVGTKLRTAPLPLPAERPWSSEVSRRVESHFAKNAEISERIERDQTEQQKSREYWLELEQKKYGLKRRARDIYGMPA
jgi:hypothetical protein